MFHIVQNSHINIVARKLNVVPFRLYLRIIAIVNVCRSRWANSFILYLVLTKPLRNWKWSSTSHFGKLRQNLTYFLVPIYLSTYFHLISCQIQLANLAGVPVSSPLSCVTMCHQLKFFLHNYSIWAVLVLHYYFKLKPTSTSSTLIIDGWLICYLWKHLVETRLFSFGLVSWYWSPFVHWLRSSLEEFCNVIDLAMVQAPFSNWMVGSSEEILENFF